MRPILLLLLVTSLHSWSPNGSKFTLDYPLSSQMGADNLATLGTFAHHLENWAIEPWFTELPTFVGRWARLSKITFLDLPLSQYMVAIQHEVFGHGARLRYLHRDARYSLPAPFPWGPGGGATFFAPIDSLPLPIQAGIATGGIEASELFGYTLATRALSCCCLDYRDAITYILASQDQTLYIYGTRRPDGEENDMKAYIAAVNDSYGKKVLTTGKLRSKTWLNLIDPLLISSAARINDYLAQGNTGAPVTFKFPFPGGWAAIPQARLTLAPYGLEYGGQLYLFKPPFLFRLFGRYGNTEGHTSYAAGLDTWDLWRRGNWGLGAKIEIWKQPKLRHNCLDTAPSKWGTLLLARLAYRLTTNTALSLESGGKTAGFSIGEPLDPCLFIRLGFNWLCF